MTEKVKRIQVRMSETQYNTLTSEADEMGLNVSDYLRHILSVYRAVQSHTAASES